MQITPIAAQSHVFDQRKHLFAAFTETEAKVSGSRISTAHHSPAFQPVRSSDRHYSAQSEFATQIAAGTGAYANHLDRENRIASYAAIGGAPGSPSLQVSV